MGRPLEARFFAADFETTVFENQESTEVWAAGIAELNSEEINIFNSIDAFFDYLSSQKSNCIVYFHNLKFDGSFILYYLMFKRKFFHAMGRDENGKEIYTNRVMPANSFKYIISDSGLWYSITCKIKGKIIQFRDSYKLIPFTIEKIANDFNTSVKKLEIEYEGRRAAGEELTKKEIEYLKNDVIILKEALEKMQKNDALKITIGAACISEFKKIMGIHDYEFLFPDLTKFKIDPDVYGAETAEEYVRKSYRGGYCYLVPQKAGKIHKNGITLDVNSLYPDEMDKKPMPVGYPKFYKGLPPENMRKDKYTFIRIKAKFDLKKGYLPTIQIKKQLRFVPNEYLKTSDFFDPITKKYYDHYKINDEVFDTSVILTLTETDFEIMKEHYNFKYLEILDSCTFSTMTGIFSQYISKYRRIKENAKTDSERTLAKLFLNNLAGKMATNWKADYKVINQKEENKISFSSRIHSRNEVVFIPIGAAITAYARKKTIGAAQANYHGSSKPGFIYSDTDSIHCDLPEDEIKGVEIHNSDFGKWKIECRWKEAKFLRQKTYVEIENNNIIIKAAGMPKKSKELFIRSYEGKTKPLKKFTDEENKFISKKRTLKDFKFGLQIPGKLLPVRIPGGTVLRKTKFELTP